MFFWGFPGDSVAKNLSASAGDTGWIPGERTPIGGNGNLKNPTERRAWRAIVHGDAKSWTQLSMHSCF